MREFTPWSFLSAPPQPQRRPRASWPQPAQVSTHAGGVGPGHQRPLWGKSSRSVRTSRPPHAVQRKTPENAARAFEGEWSSAVPGLPTGQAQLFEDGRIHWFEGHLGGFRGLDVLELGPLEGGHTCMMTQRGATVLAIESNLRAWMRCLVAKQAAGGMPGATFLLGNFVKYVQAASRRFDFVLASGVLYHMTDPVGLLRGLTATSDAIGLWTHYFEPGMLERRDALRRKFSPTPRVVSLGVV